MNFVEALARQEQIEAELASAEAELRAFPRGPTGLTPDAIKAAPEWRAAKLRSSRAFKALQDYNTVFLKRFARELRALREERNERRRTIALGASVPRHDVLALEASRTLSGESLSDE